MNEKNNLRGSILTFEMFHGRKENSIGSSKIRGTWMMNYWDELERFKMGKEFDFVIFQKAYWREYVKEFKGIKILDICDPDYMNWQYRIKEFTDDCDAVVTSTQALADDMKNFITDIPVVCIPDRLDLKELDNMKIKEHTEVAQWVVWYGYSTNFEMLGGIEYHLKKNNLGLMVISDNEYILQGGYKETDVPLKNIKWNSETINENIQLGDMVINPTSKKGKWKFKSNNKTIMAWGLGMPVAVSPDDFVKFKDPIERTKEVVIRQKEIREKWDVKKSVEEYKELINSIKKK